MHRKGTQSSRNYKRLVLKKQGFLVIFLVVVVINYLANNSSYFYKAIFFFFLLHLRISLWITSIQRDLTTAPAEQIVWAVQSTHHFLGTPLVPEMAPRTTMSAQPNEMETRVYWEGPAKYPWSFDSGNAPTMDAHVPTFLTPPTAAPSPPSRTSPTY